MTSEIISATPPSGDLADDEPGGSEQRVVRVEPSDHGLRIDKWLATHLPEFSRAYFQQLLESGAVIVAGRLVLKPATKVRVGDEVSVELRPTAQASAFMPESIPLTVVYEDDHLMVIDKPAGLVVHPAAGHWQGTLLNGLLAHHRAAAHLPRAGIVHRLDKDTSGLMVVAKSSQAFDGLVRAIAAREVHRVYLALAHGPWRGEPERWVDQPLGRDPRQRLRMAVLSAGHASAKPAQTRVRLLDAAGPCVLVGCKLHTGRTHQIRVHMAWLGLPLVGDVLYGGRPALGMSRQALHAQRLGLFHPVGGQWMSFESPLPADMEGALTEADLHYNPENVWSLASPPLEAVTPRTP